MSKRVRGAKDIDSSLVCHNCYDAHQSENDLLKEAQRLGSTVEKLALDAAFLKNEIVLGRSKAAGHHESAAIMAREEMASNEEALTEQYVTIEEARNHVAHLYVTIAQLHSSRDRAETLAAIREVVRNLIGSEEIAVFESTPDGSALSLVASTCIDASRYQKVELGSGIIGQVGLTGRPYFVDDLNDINQASNEFDITACIPLTLNGEVTGAIAIFRLLPQKPLDQELLDALAVHGAVALARTRQGGVQEELSGAPSPRQQSAEST